MLHQQSLVLLLLNLAVGVLTRSAPALNLFSFGFPATMVVTLGMLYLTAPGLVAGFEGVVAEAVERLAAVMGVAGG